MQDERRSSRLLALRAAGLLAGQGRSEFENQVALVRDVLDVPVAIVSLIEADRQVFAAHLGLPEPWASAGETPLTHSFCQHVVQACEPLIVPDSHKEPIVKGNLAITDLHVRAYLGVPLALPSGEVVGALAAIQSEPREWSERDISLMRSIARVVADEIATRVAETQWRGLFDTLHEGFILGRVIRDAAGRVTDWRYERVNRAWGELVGIASEEATGKTIRELIPGIEDEWVNEFADVVNTGQPIRFTRQVGAFGRWYDGVVQPTGQDTFSVLFLEVTDRIQAQRRREAQAELGDRLRDAMTVEEAGFAASEILARVLGGTRAGYGIVDASAEKVRVLPDWCAPGIAGIAGTHTFRDFGSYIEELKQGQNVIIPNVALDARTVRSVDAFHALDITALFNLPIMERGKLVGITLVHDKDAKPITSDELAFIKSVADRTQAAVARIQAETQQHLLNQEISHRLKNSLALVQAVASQTLRSVEDSEPVKAFEKRLHALSSAHDILLRRSWTTASMSAVILASLETLGQAERVDVSGPDVELGSRASLSLALLIHELATNAMKYGALSKSDGQVSASWATNGDLLTFRWEERGGPPVQEPSSKGFGSRMIRMGLVGAGGVDTRYDPTGFTAVMNASLGQMRAA